MTPRERSRRSRTLALMTGECAPAPDPVLKLRAALPAGTVARRRIPEDPAVRARLIARRLAEITGPQHVIVTCAWCGTDWAEENYGAGYTAGPDGLAACANRDACDTRAAEAGLVPVIGGPQDGDDVA